MHLKITRFAVVTLLLASWQVCAKEFHWQPRLISGVQFYTLDKRVQTDLDGASLEAETPAMVIFGLGSSAVYGKWYAGAQLQRARSMSFASTNLSDSEQTLERMDFSLSLGRQLPWRFSVFLGYKWGSTTIDETFVLPDLPETHASEKTTLSFSSRYVVAGPFVGLGYGLPLGEHSLLSTSLAYGMLNTTLSSNLPFPTPGEDPAEDTSSSGISFGLALKTAFYQHYLLTNSVSCQHYAFDFDLPTAGADYQVKESICNLIVGLGYSF